MTTTAAEQAAATEKTAAATPTVANAPEKRRALGRGLDSLLPAGPRVVSATVPGAPAATLPPFEKREGWGTQQTDGRDARPSIDSSGAHEIVLPEVQAQAARRAPAPHAPGESVEQIPLERVDQNPYQTRRKFDEDALIDLTESIKANGVVQPIVVRQRGERYVLVVGERRLRAASRAGKTTIPAIVRTLSDQQAAEITLIENLQREDLNCLEQAEAFGTLSKEFGLTQEQIGNRVGLSRESVSNYMRLLKLPGQVLTYLRDGYLGFSEARELMALPDDAAIEKLAREAVEKHWSYFLLVEAVEAITLRTDVLPQPETSRARWVDPNVRAAQRELETILGVRVRIRDRKGKGRIVIEYATLDDYDRVVGMLKGKTNR